MMIMIFFIRVRQVVVHLENEYNTYKYARRKQENVDRMSFHTRKRTVQA